MSIARDGRASFLSLLLCVASVAALPSQLAERAQHSPPLPTTAPPPQLLHPRQANGLADSPLLGGVPSGLRAGLMPRSSKGCEAIPDCSILYSVSTRIARATREPLTCSQSVIVNYLASGTPSTACLSTVTQTWPSAPRITSM